MLRSTPGTVPIDPRWWRNDGLVPLVSQGSPDGPAPLLRVGTQPRPGRWTDLGLLDGYDHFDVTGLTGRYDVSGLYRALASLLQSLPARPQPAAGAAHTDSVQFLTSENGTRMYSTSQNPYVFLLPPVGLNP